MSYLNLAGVKSEDFSKTIISVWFRVPQSAIDAAFAASTGDGSPLDGIIPLVVMGKSGSTSTFSTVTTSVVSFRSTATGPAGGGGVSGPTIAFSDFSGPPLFNYTETATTIWTPANVTSGSEESFSNVEKSSPAPSTPTNPTCIGIDCSFESGPILYINFETNKKGTASGYRFELRSIDPGTANAVDPTISDWGLTGSHVVTDRYNTFVGFLFNISDVNTATSAAPPEAYVNNGIISRTTETKHWADFSDVVLSTTAAITSDQIAITADVWHHALISLNLQTMTTNGGNTPGSLAQYVSSASSLFAALDDKDYSGFDLSPYWTEREGAPNDVISADALRVAGATLPRDDAGNVLGTPAYSIENPTIPFGNNAMGLPATTKFVDDIYNVEMGEFQMFTGVFADTSDVNIRRYFIDSQGKPVSPTQKQVVDSQGNITQGSGSIEGIGQQPDVLLHKSTNWIKGRNTGSLGMDYSQTPPQIIDSGQFTPTAKITKYKPEPSLHGPQGPS